MPQRETITATLEDEFGREFEAQVEYTFDTIHHSLCQHETIVIDYDVLKGNVHPDDIVALAQDLGGKVIFECKLPTV